MRFFVFCFLILLCWQSQASTIPVGPKQKTTSIKAAIQLAQPGDTLLIKPGIYQEGNITISKRLVFLGESWPVIDANNKFENITVSAQHVVISGLKIINSGISSMQDMAGVGAENADYLQVINCRFDNTFFAIHISNSDSVMIWNNVMEGNLKAEHQTGNGIHLWKCNSASIKNNKVFNHRDGIYFEFVTNSLIQGNYCERNLRYGLHFMFSHHDIYRSNTFKSNGAGVAVMYTNHVEMYDNKFELNWGDASYGLLLKEISDCYIEGNAFKENTVGIFMEGTNRGRFKQNIFESNGWAVKIQASCENNLFERNNFSGNSFDIVTNGTLVLNKFDHNYWDKFQGYDLDKDGVGDVPFRPVSMYAMVIDKIPEAVLLWRSFLVFLLDKTERVVPAMIPEKLKDDHPQMNPYDFNTKG